MPWKYWEYNCEDCGKFVGRNRKSTDPRICVECGQDRMRLGRRLEGRPVSFTVNGEGEVLST